MSVTAGAMRFEDRLRALRSALGSSPAAVLGVTVSGAAADPVGVLAAFGLDVSDRVVVPSGIDDRLVADGDRPLLQRALDSARRRGSASTLVRLAAGAIAELTVVFLGDEAAPVTAMVIGPSDAQPLAGASDAQPLAGAADPGQLATLSPDAVVVVDENDCYHYANLAAAKLLGASRPEDLVGRRVRDIDASEPSVDIAHRRREAVRAGQTVHSSRENLHTPDGRIVPVEVSSAPYDLGGGRAGVLSVIRDMSDRELAEAAREVLHLQQATTLEALAEGVVLCSVGPDGRLAPALVNTAARDLLGPDPAELVAPAGRATPRPIRAADGSPLQSEDLPVPATAATGKPIDGFVWGVEHDNGEVVWMRSASRPVLTPAGRVVGVVLSMVDITTEHEAARSLLAAHARFAALVEHSSDVIIVLDADGVVRYASPAYASVYGEEAGGRVGQPLAERLHPDDRVHLGEALAALRAAPERTVTFGCRVRHEDGSERHLELTAANRLADPAVGGIVTNTRDVTDWVQTARRLAHHAQHDSLTGLPNRDFLLHRLAAAMRSASATGAPCALLYMDLDHFKHVNDSLGHAAGDSLLVVVAERVSACLRPRDVVCRIGGDEMVVLAEEVGGVRDAVAIAERIRRVLSEPVTVDGMILTPTCSIGIAISVDAEPESLLRQADTALYKAKEDGRDRWAVYQPAMQLGARHRIDTEVRARAAVRGGSVAVHYQPIIALADGRLAGREALVRVGGEGDEHIEPGDLISVAEQSELIVDLGSAVLRTACADAAAWPPGPILSVNVAARQVRPALVEEVRGLLATHGLAPGQLCLELTESALMGAEGPARDAVEALHQLGVGLALDDFGTRSSSLADLRRFPVGMVKIDRSFTARLGSEPDGEVIKAIIRLARALGLTTVAKGVETAEQATLLGDYGCELGQGHFFGRPVPAPTSALAGRS